METIIQTILSSAGILLVGLVFFIVLWNSFANAGAKQYITLERRWVGKSMTDGRTVALAGEIGLQAKILGPGLHWFIPFINKAMKHPVIVVGANQFLALEAVTGVDLPVGEFFGKPVLCNDFKDAEMFLRNNGQKGYQLAMLPPGEYMINPHVFSWKIGQEIVIGEDEVGMIEASVGAPIPAGRIFADPVECNGFADAEMFLKNGGQKGPQIPVITPGKLRVNPFLFTCHKNAVTTIPGGCLGTVYAVDGKPVPDGSLLAIKVDGHDNFQKGSDFIKAGGQKGRQLEILMPGSYRINTMLFKVENEHPWVNIEADKIGVVTVMEGKPITDPKEIAAAEVDLALHGNFQNAAAFLAAGGQKGLQIPVLRSGNYAINPWFASVEVEPMTLVDIGKCGVVISFVGKEGDDTSDEKVNAKIVENGCKGIWKEPLGPGKHPINTKCYKVEMVPTNQITLSWADSRTNAHDLDSNLKTITLRTADAFSVNMDVNVIIHIPMANAPKVIANQGSIASLISQVLEPAISSHFRNAAQYIKALDLYTKRKELQETAKVHIVNVLKEHFIDSKDTLIADVVLPVELTKIVSDKQIAEQEKETRKVQTEAENERKNLANMKAQADMQQDVVKSERGVEIAKNLASSAKEAANGAAEASKLKANADAENTKVTANAKAEATKVNASADAEAVEKVGTAEAKVIELKGDATGKAYEKQAAAMGKESFAQLQMIEQIAGSDMKLIPDVLITGNGGGGQGGGGQLENMLGLILVEKLTGKEFKIVPTVTPDAPAAGTPEKK
jgi:uncharacterized membrane protein YqiK